MKKTKIQKLLQAFSNSEDKNLEGFKAFDDGVEKLKAELKKKIQVNTLDEVGTELDKFKKRIDIEPLIQAVETLQENFTNEVDSLIEQLNTRTVELSNLNTSSGKEAIAKYAELNDEISNVRGQLKDFISEKNKTLDSIKTDFDNKITTLESKTLSDVTSKVAFINQKINDADKVYKKDKDKIEKDISSLSSEVPKLKSELLSRLADRGAGNMNRQIVVGGNPSTLGKYTDINLKAGNNVTITYTNNETTKRTDITFSATGGSSSVGGTVRQIQTISTSTTIPTLTGTDQVYLCDQGIQVVLPSAVSDTNLYTVKNISNSSILVVGTIDNDINGVIMPVKYTSIDIISNNTNWNIT